MPVFVTKAIGGGAPLKIPFVTDVYQDTVDNDLSSGPFMSIVAVERFVRSSKQLADLVSSEDVLVFLEEGQTDPVIDKVVDGTCLSLVVQKGRPDYRWKNLFDALERKNVSELTGTLLSLKHSIVRLPDAEMPDGWRYSLQHVFM